ncbi:ankyrin repeat-containing domain protein [Thelonectria olida]|uniref:Ankyrin repeat-containing domain protein n=1 Tax=Thelonectria olida TaxID=1576542 RepID=A0A9P9ATP8_9HYPO|nr:ankyrin repeat-containing domain protein [Thelonectria olida]
MSWRITGLIETTFSLASDITSHLKAHDATARRELRILAAELRLLGGTLYSLDQFMCELDREGNGESDALATDESKPWPIIHGCEFLLQILTSLYKFVKPHGLEDARSALIGYRSKFGFVLGSSESLQDVFIHFSVLDKEPMPEMQLEDNQAKEAPTSRPGAPATIEEEPTSEQLFSWLGTLNSPDHDREPEEYASEMALVQARRLASPLYRTASTRWPAHAESRWPELRTPICSLFQAPRSFNFVQWTLEYARETYPRTFGNLALTTKWHLELTNALCAEQILPLHMAAALGLPSLCAALITSEADVNHVGFLGSPLFCALVGPNVLKTQANPESWSDLLDTSHASNNRAATILALLDSPADVNYCFNWKNSVQVSLAGVAFWAALIMDNEEIFTEIVRSVTNMDSAFLQLLERDGLVDQAVTSKTFSRLLTHVFDLTLGETGNERFKDQLREAVRKLMSESGIYFCFKDGDPRLLHVRDRSINIFIRESVVDSDMLLFQRLLAEPRFDPDLPYDEDKIGGTILHMAVEGGHLKIMECLIKAGSNLKATDVGGRTPVMVVEDAAALSALVLEHGASTTDVDNDGRTIWHYAAATNFYGLIEWLSEHDPNKQQNLATCSKAGLTPLADAFLNVKDFGEQHKSFAPPEPAALRLLLLEDHTPETMKSPDSLLEAAIQWGKLDLLERMLKLGYGQGRQDHSRLLRSLHIGVPDDMLHRVLEVCKGLPLVFPDGTTVPETILTNTELCPVHGAAEFQKPTGHPSCYPKMTPSQFETLLTPEVLKARDSQGRGIWQRFCDYVLPMLRGRNCTHPSRMEFLSHFICQVIPLLVKHGALEDFERERGKWALLYMADGEGLHPSWERYQFPFIKAVLEATNKESKYFQTMDAAFLLSQAARRGQLEVISLLIDNGLPVDLLRRELGDESLLEHIISDVKVFGALQETLVKKLKPGSLVSRQHIILEKLLDIPPSFEPAGVLGKLLWKKLIDPNQVSSTAAQKNTMLQEVLQREKPEFACTLLQYGADPTLSFSKVFPIHEAAEKGYVTVLEKIREDAPYFDWFVRSDRPGRPSYNAMQIAALHGRASALTWLLERTTLWSIINETTPRNGNAPIHLAIFSGDLDCVQILAQHGADLELRDYDGCTPLLRAVHKGHEEIIGFLLKSGVDTETDLYGIRVLSGWRPAPTRVVKDFVATKFKEYGIPELTKPDPVKLGFILAEMIECHGTWNDSAFKAIIPDIPKEDLMAAILPCRGCTLLSLAGANGCTRMMLELVELGFGGFITGCSKHWVHGYNALHHACFGLLGQIDREEEALVESTLLFIRKCLDAYLDDGMLWFQVPCSPLAVVQFGNGNRTPDWNVYERALDELLQHVETHTDRYWKLMSESGLTFLCDDTPEDQTTCQKLLRYIVNRRCETLEWLEYAGGAFPSPLHLVIEAIERDWKEENAIGPILNMVQRLIACGADVNAQDGELLTPLFFAASKGVLPIIKALLEAGANPNIREETGCTPLSRAMEWGNMDVVRLLMEHGADPSTFLGPSINFIYTEYDNQYINDVAKFGFDNHAVGPGNSSLATLLLSQSSTTRTALLSKDIDFDRIVTDQPSIFYLLLSRNIGPLPLKRVLRRIPVEYLDRIVNPTASINAQAVCYPLRQGSTAILEVLFENGWDCERDVSNGGSALMFACSMGSLRSVKMLVRRGARLSYLADGNRGEKIVKSAFEEARLYPKIVKWLLVGRHQDRRRLEWAVDSSAEVATMPWAGPRKGAHKLSGFDGHHLKACSEGVSEQLALLARIGRIKAELAGRIVAVTLVE